MIKICEDKPIDGEKLAESLKKGYGIPHPEKVSGYSGLFFHLGEVFASDTIARIMESSESFHDFIISCLKRF